jgi:hypothetical protein
MLYCNNQDSTGQFLHDFLFRRNLVRCKASNLVLKISHNKYPIAVFHNNTNFSILLVCAKFVTLHLLQGPLCLLLWCVGHSPPPCCCVVCWVHTTHHNNTNTQRIPSDIMEISHIILFLCLTTLCYSQAA